MNPDEARHAEVLRRYFAVLTFLGALVSGLNPNLLVGPVQPLASDVAG
jgi:hypothetical protein